MTTNTVAKISTVRLTLTGNYSDVRNHKRFTVQHVEIITGGSAGTTVTIGGPLVVSGNYTYNIYTQAEVEAGNGPKWLSPMLKEELARLESPEEKIAKIVELLEQIEATSDTTGVESEWLKGNYFGASNTAKAIRQILEG